MVAAPAQAADTVNDVSLAWSINDESGGGAYFGGCNFLSAGAAGNTGSSRVWTETDGFYAASAGNVSLAKPVDGEGTVSPTWATKCQNSAGAAVGTGAGSTTGTVATFAGGTGEVSLAAGTAEIDWTGALTVAFYGGMTYWTLSNPHLSVANGHGTLTATGSGYGASMDDPDVWEPLTPQTITLATLSSVVLGEEGFEIAPDYLGVEVTPVSGAAQNRTGQYWGSFPQDFVAFHALTGQSSYWYSSGGAADPKKVARPIAVEWQLAGPPSPAPRVTVSDVAVSSTGETDITITGSGFDPQSSIAIYPPLAGSPGGVYIAFGKFAQVWKPSEGAGSAARPNAGVKWAVLAEHVDQVGGTANGAVVLGADGTFTATLTISKAAADANGITDGRYGIYTYPGGGAATPAFETFTAVEFLDPGDIPIDVTVPEETPPPPPGEFTWTITDSSAVAMGTALAGADAFTASGALPIIEVSDTRTAAPAWSISGQVSDFVGGDKAFDGKALGWTPSIVANTVDAVAGASVAPGAGGTGLTASRTLAASALGHALGSAQVTAGLSLAIPLDTDAGDYTGILTLTAIG
jgi:hypothetical protein